MWKAWVMENLQYYLLYQQPELQYFLMYVNYSTTRSTSTVPEYDTYDTRVASFSDVISMVKQIVKSAR